MNLKLTEELMWLLVPISLRKPSSTKERMEEDKKKNQVTRYDKAKATPVVTPVTETKPTRTVINH
jgi:hypothetical protein